MKVFGFLAAVVFWATCAFAVPPNLADSRPDGHFQANQLTIANLRQAEQAHVLVPLTPGVFGDAMLEHIDVWGGAKIERHEADGKVTVVTPPDTRYFKGTIVGDASAFVMVAVDKTTTHGTIVKNGHVYMFGPSSPDSTDQIALETAIAIPPNSLHHNEPLPVPPEARKKGKVLALTGPVTASVAVETDNELWAKFGSDTNTLKYIGDLFAAANVIYNRDAKVTLKIGYTSLWPTGVTDPWTATNSSTALTQLINYWKANHATLARATVHQLSGRSLGGGISYLDALCNTSYGFSVSAVDGSFNVLDPYKTWDLIVFTHETGHIFSSPHAHFFVPPVDECYGSESGCYSGPVVCTRGTIMSYCHLCGGGVANIDLMFGPVVSAKIRQGADAAGCLTATVTSTTLVPVSTTTITTVTTSTSTTGVVATTTTSAPGTTTTTLCKKRHAPCASAAECCSGRCRKSTHRCARRLTANSDREIG